VQKIKRYFPSIDVICLPHPEHTMVAPQVVKVALLGAILGFLVTLPLYTGFDKLTSAMQFVEFRDWIPHFNIHYHLGIDGISVLFILLNSFFTPLVVLAGWKVIEKRVAQYMAAFLIMSGIVNGVFASLDAMLFYVFWEAMLIPMFLIIGVWGGANRVYAAVKFFLYTLLGSLLMLVAFIYLYKQSGGSFSILDYHALPLALNAQILIFIAFFMAFAVKVPMFPVHTWLPDAHVEAPTGGSVVLAAIMLKLGADRTGCQPRAGVGDDHLVADRSGVHRPGGFDAVRHEKAGCLFIDFAHGICHPGLLYV